MTNDSEATSTLSGKRCGTCGAVKPPGEYNRKSSRPDGLQEVCRECNRLSSRAYYHRRCEHHLAVVRARTEARRSDNTAFVAAYLLTHPCVDCGASDLRVLDFDHRPGAGKREAVMRLVRDGFSRQTIEIEIARCDVRCRNCHAIVTYQRLGGDWRTRAMDAAAEVEPR